MRIAGKKVVDARGKLTLSITQRDCDKGNTKDPAACAAALALIRQTHAKSARVHLGRVYVDNGTHWTRYSTPKSLRTEIVAFDRGGTFEPGDYVLTPMPPAQQLGAHYGGVHHKKKRTNRKIARIQHHVTSGVRHALAK